MEAKDIYKEFFEEPSKLNEMSDFLNSALTRQIPIPPKRVNGDNVCPLCGDSEITSRRFPLIEPEVTYCRWCGQAILWLPPVENYTKWRGYK